MLNDLITSEFNNVGELLGIGELDAALQNMTPKEQRKAMMRMATQVKMSRRSRGEMEKFFRELPRHIRHELIKGRLRLSDYTLYTMKRITSKTIKMFEPQDDKEIGVRNISNAKLPKNSAFLVSGIILLTGTSQNYQNPEENKAINFRTISTIPAIANGEFSLKANRRQIVPENQSNRRFVTDNDNSLQWGYYKLDNPRLIKDEELIELTIELGTLNGVTDNQFIWAGLDGTGTTP